MVVLTALSASLGAFSFASKTIDNYNPSPGLNDYQAWKEIGDNFPLLLNSDVEAVLVRRKDNATFDPRSADTENLEQLFQKLTNDVKSIVNSSYPDNKDGQSPLLRVDSFYTYYKNFAFVGVSTQFIHPPNPFGQVSAMMLAMHFNNDKSLLTPSGTDFVEATSDIVKDMQQKVDEIGKDYPNYDIVLTGQIACKALAAKKTGIGFAIGDGSGLPFIFIIFWALVGSWRMLIIPCVALACSLIVSDFVGNLIAITGIFDIPSYEPNIMLFLCLALSVDYSFFLLSRMQEERRKIEREGDKSCCCVSMCKGRGQPYINAVRISLRQSGATVAVSGSILVVTWLAQLAFPVYGFDAVGVCSAVTVAVCVIVNLLMCPAMLLALPGFFDGGSLSVKEDLRSCCCCFFKSRLEKKKSMFTDDTTADLSRSLVKDDQGLESVDDKSRKRCCGGGCCGKNPEHNCYFTVAMYATRMPYNFILPGILFAVLAAGSLLLAWTKLSLGGQIDFGTGAAVQAYTYLIQNFYANFLTFPFTILISTTNGILEADVFQYQCDLAFKLNTTVDGLVMQALSGVGFRVVNTPPSFDPVLECVSAATAINWLDMPTPNFDAELYRYYWPQLVSASNDTTVMGFNPDFNPFSTQSRVFIQSVRDVIDSIEPPAGVQTYFYHPMVTELDAEAFTFARLPWVLVITLLIAFALVATRFRAAFVPVKLALTIMLPIVFLFGCAVAVYQFGVLDFLHVDAFSSDKSNGLSWIIPASTIFVLMGLALDYEIFLFSRVYEIRGNPDLARELTCDSELELDEDQAAIVAAVELTGPIISGAGVICAFAFLGMLLNTSTFLNQFGFIMILGILLDTFVVRVMLVPSLLSIGGWSNWWPRRMPGDEKE